MQKRGGQSEEKGAKIVEDIEVHEKATKLKENCEQIKGARRLKKGQKIEDNFPPHLEDHAS